MRCETCGAHITRLPCGACLLSLGLESPDPPAPELYGPYQIVRRLGEGGMGAVYLAEQLTPIHRQVALKVIKPGMDSSEVLSRFTYERQALALMDHPNIAHVFEAGTTPSGLPFFVMEYINGEPITTYCDRHNLTTRARLHLFLQVCQALRHAHQKGVIHRDIKPSNILVTEVAGQPVPKVIDFGIARAVNLASPHTAFTQLGQIIGTPEYMSPEAADTTNPDIDTASDVYSLGVLLYELLTGALPFNASALRRAGIIELLRAIREDDFPPITANLTDPAIAAHRQTSPQALKRQLAGDLSWIVAKAVEKSRSRRYPTVSDFAADLERHLADLPVSAGPPSLLYKCRKFVRRHRLAVIAAALVLVAVIGGASAALWQASVANRERTNALEALARAEQARKLAVDAEGRAAASLLDVRALSNAMLFEMDDQVKSLPGATPVRQALVRMGLQYLDKSTNSDHPSLGPAYFRMGELQGREVLMDTAGARQNYHRALRLLEAANPPTPASRHTMAMARLRLAEYAETNAIRDAELKTASAILEPLLRAAPRNPGFAETLAFVRMAQGRLSEASRLAALAPPEHRPALLAELVAQHTRRREFHLAAEAGAEGLKLVESFLKTQPTHTVYRFQQALLALRVGEALHIRGNFPDSRTEAVKALNLYQSLATEDPENAVFQLHLAQAEQLMGMATIRTGQRGESDTHYARALSIARAQHNRYPENDTAAAIAAAIAKEITQRDYAYQNWQGAADAAREATTILESQLARHPANRVLLNSRAEAVLMVADCLLLLGDLLQALPYHQKALRLVRHINGPEASTEDRDLAVIAASQAARFKQQSGRPAQAIEHYKRAVQLAERNPGSGQLKDNVNRLITILQQQSRFTDALQVTRKYTALAENSYKSNPSNQEGLDLWNLLFRLRTLEVSAGSPQAGIAAAERALQLARELLAADPKNTNSQQLVTNSEINLGISFGMAGDRARAIDVFRRQGKSLMDVNWRSESAPRRESLANNLVTLSTSILTSQLPMEGLPYAERAKEIAASLVALDSKNGRYRNLFLNASSQAVVNNVNAGVPAESLRQSAALARERRKTLGANAAAWLQLAREEATNASQYRRLNLPAEARDGWRAALLTVSEAIRFAEAATTRDPDDLRALEVLRDAWWHRALLEELFGEPAAETSYATAVAIGTRLLAADPRETLRRDWLRDAQGQLHRWRTHSPSFLRDLLDGKPVWNLAAEEHTLENALRWHVFVSRLQSILLDVNPRLQAARFNADLARRVLARNPSPQARAHLARSLYQLTFHLNFARNYQLGLAKEQLRAEGITALNEAIAIASSMRAAGQWPPDDLRIIGSMKLMRESMIEVR